MKVVFVSGFLNHHQKPLCEELRANCDEFYFVSTECVANVGYQVAGDADYVLYYFDDAQKEKALEKIAEADFVIFGSGSDELIRYRMSQNKLSFVYAERFFKKGAYRRFIPSTRRKIKRKIIDFRDKNLYVLSASAFLSYDLALLGFPSEKCFKWGYFPKSIEYEEIDEIFENKKKASILWCGRMLACKRPQNSLIMAKRLKDRGYNFELNIIGDGPLMEKMQRMLEKLNISDCVHILGSKPYDEVLSYMKSSQIFVFHSTRMEGWGAVINEAMNGGCAVVASHAVGSVPFLVKPKETGEIYRSKNIKDLCEKASFLLSNQDKTRVMGEAAYKSIITEWNAKEAVKRLLILANSLLEGSQDVSFEDGPCSNARIIKDNWYK